MPNYAQATIIGHLGSDPETREVGDNTVTSFSVAVTKKRKGKDDVTTWFKVSAWNKTGELAAQYLKKGSPCLVVGDVSQESYKGKDGNDRYQVCVTADRVVFLAGKKDGDESPLGEAKSVGEGVAKLMAKAAAIDAGNEPPF